MNQYVHVTNADTPMRDGTIKLHGPEGFEGMRKAGQLAALADPACDPIGRRVTIRHADGINSFTVAA